MIEALRVTGRGIPMADGDATIILDQGGVNARILAKEAKVDFRRVESASRKIQATFCSPEVKRLFVRYFNSMQLNMYITSVIARTKLPHPVIEKIESALKLQLEKLHADMNEASDSAEALCKVHGISRLATYDTEPLAIEAKVISSFGRRYLELLTKVDQLMPMLESLAIDEVIEVLQRDLRKALAKKSARQVAGAARNFAVGLRQKAHLKSQDAMADARDTKFAAQYKVAKERCDLLSGDAKDACIKQAKVQYGQ
jgi:predicted nucleic acid-binding protein